MKFVRWAMVGAALYAMFRKMNNPAASPLAGHDSGEEGNCDRAGLAAIFQTREAADLAVEHLVQEQGVDRNAIFIEAVGDENSAGTEASGGDHAALGQKAREDAQLKGALRLTVASAVGKVGALEYVLRGAGAESIRVI